MWPRFRLRFVRVPCLYILESTHTLSPDLSLRALNAHGREGVSPLAFTASQLFLCTVRLPCHCLFYGENWNWNPARAVGISRRLARAGHFLRFGGRWRKHRIKYLCSVRAVRVSTIHPREETIRQYNRAKCIRDCKVLKPWNVFQWGVVVILFVVRLLCARVIQKLQEKYKGTNGNKKKSWNLKMGEGCAISHVKRVIITKCFVCFFLLVLLNILVLRIWSADTAVVVSGSSSS